jgi:protein-tyrosine phosphatase
LRAADLAKSRAALTKSLDARGIDLEIVQGGEVSPERVRSLRDEDLRALTLGDGPWILLECPFSPVASTLYLLVRDLQRRGFRVLLAHPERSPAFQSEPTRLARLIDSGALAQVTAGAVVGDFGAAVRRTALRFLEAGLVQVLASDARGVLVVEQRIDRGFRPGRGHARERPLGSAHDQQEVVDERGGVAFSTAGLTG